MQTFLLALTKLMHNNIKEGISSQITSGQHSGCHFLPGGGLDSSVTVVTQALPLFSTIESGSLALLADQRHQVKVGARIGTLNTGSPIEIGLFPGTIRDSAVGRNVFVVLA